MKLKFTFLFLTFCFFLNAQNPQVQEVQKLYMSGDYDQTIEKANEYLAKEPENVDYQLMLGRALTDIGKYEDAIPYLEFAIEKDNSWRKAWALGYSGSCYFMLQNYEKSKTAIKSCIEFNATKNATNYAYKRLLLFGYDDFFKDWKIQESDNIRFYFQKMSESDIEIFIQSRENAYEQINKFFNSTLPKKIDFFVWNSREDAKKILRADLGFADPSYCIIHSYFQQTKGHEITHVISNYSNEMVQKTGLINEGTSVCFDLSNNNKEEMVSTFLKSNNQKIDIKDLWSNWTLYPQELSYPLSGLFVKEMIMKFGKEKFLVFFTNQTYDNARAVFGDEIDVFIEVFERKYNG